VVFLLNYPDVRRRCDHQHTTCSEQPKRTDSCGRPGRRCHHAEHGACGGGAVVQQHFECGDTTHGSIPIAVNGCELLQRSDDGIAERAQHIAAARRPVRTTRFTPVPRPDLFQERFGRGRWAIKNDRDRMKSGRLLDVSRMSSSGRYDPCSPLPSPYFQVVLEDSAPISCSSTRHAGYQGLVGKV